MVWHGDSLLGLLCDVDITSTKNPVCLSQAALPLAFFVACTTHWPLSLRCFDRYHRSLRCQCVTSRRTSQRYTPASTTLNESRYTPFLKSRICGDTITSLSCFDDALYLATVANRAYQTSP